MADNLVKVNFKDAGTNKELAPKSLAESIYFNDGESLQFKYDNGKLTSSDIFEGIQAVSPTIEVIENTDGTFRLKITDINGSIISPNLVGPKGPKGDLSDGSGEVLKTLSTFEMEFAANDFQKINEHTYLLRISRSVHELGFYGKIAEVIRHTSDTESVNIDFSYKRLVNGDLILVVNEPMAGIAYLEGENN